MTADAVTDWLLDPQRADPAIRWQVLRDLLDAPESAWRAERSKVETQGWGARLLEVEDEDGRWAGGAHFPADYVWGGDEPGQPWTSTTHVLTQLREFGLDPASERAQRMVALIGANCRWEHDDQPYWEGEVEPCINGITVANGAYFGVDMSPVDRLVGERLDDGGWNCEAERGSTRSSFDTTINVLEGLLAYERVTGGTPASREARRSGEEYLLRRALFRRLSTGEPADERYLLFLHPNRWHHDVLRGLDHFRSAADLTGAPPDPRLGEPVEHVRSRRSDDGTWALDGNPTGRSWFAVDDGEGRPSRWVTLRALRVLRWWDAA
ncbi:squalene cyclase [Egicoccus sp. AB-alg6-2]|uniref:squalene cyclase n=1 Tax=Egicoccus sp. AB-alg6-2 TaxID=3242692 RepID=UPI00359E503A